MCGIVGFFNPGGFNYNKAEASIIAMRDTLVHRGPDDAGSWLDSDLGIAFGHRRLSILDLSTAGKQPMISVSGRYVISFNGEIYNHLDMRSKLEKLGHLNWRGHSDTETLLVAIEYWGLEETLKKLVGMFAIALWDRQEHVISLARDRMGEKPLYYGWQNGVMIFGSELKALQVHPAFQNEIDRDVIPLYLRHGYIPSPWSIWKNIRKLKPGTWVRFTAANQNQLPETKAYWSITDAITNGQADPFTGSDDMAIDTLEKLLGQAISRQRLSDVPLGAFLSGGIDSSTVVALMQAQSSQPVKTFTIGFGEQGYNEAEHAKAVAKYLGTDHTELYVTSEQARDVIPLLPDIYDEPFGDSSGIPTHLVSKLARKHVIVSLSGDGGDELFGGYRRYSKFQRWNNRVEQLPNFVRRGLGSTLRHLPLLQSNRGRRRQELLSGLLNAEHPSELYHALIGHWLPGDTVTPSTSEAQYWLNSDALDFTLKNPVDHAMLADTMTYLPDDILVKVDRAAMAVSLETRVPLLDHQIVEWSWSLPQHLKARGNHEKWVLRQLLYRYIPKKLMDRPKMGFGVPIGTWLRGPLMDWAEDLLDPKRMEHEGLFYPQPIQKKWKEHIAEKSNWEYHLWDVLMFQAWLRNQPK